MDLVKKVIVLVCSIILVGFTLTDFHSVIAEDPAYAGHLFVNKPEKQTLTAHEKKSHLGGLLLQVVYMARFLYELSVQKDKDGKKRTSARRLLLSFQDSSKI